MKKTVSILIPTYNEEENVWPLYKAIADVLQSKCQNYDYEILFIDNMSTDNTRAYLREICAQDKRAKAIFNVKNFGQFNSPFYGLRQTTGDCTILMCADFQDPVELIPVFLQHWEEGYQIVCGVKTASQENPVMYKLRSMYYRLIKKFSSIDQIEHFTGFGLYDRSFVDVLRSLDDSTPFLRGIVAELGGKRKEVPYEQQKRRAGKTHNNLYTLYDAAMLSFTSYTKIGMRIGRLCRRILFHCQFFDWIDLSDLKADLLGPLCCRAGTYDHCGVHDVLGTACVYGILGRVYRCYQYPHDAQTVGGRRRTDQF